MTGQSAQRAGLSWTNSWVGIAFAVPQAGCDPATLPASAAASAPMDADKVLNV